MRARGKKPMARTYRNKTTVPHGYVVRDDGYLYHESAPTGRKGRECWRSHYEDGSHGISSFDCPVCNPPRFRTRHTRKEKKAYRKDHHRSYRAKVSQALQEARKFDYADEWVEKVPRYRRTGGWLTW